MHLPTKFSLVVERLRSFSPGLLALDLAEPPGVTSCAVRQVRPGGRPRPARTPFINPAVCSPAGGVQGAGPLGRKAAAFRLPYLLPWRMRHGGSPLMSGLRPTTLIYNSARRGGRF